MQTFVSSFDIVMSNDYVETKFQQSLHTLTLHTITLYQSHTIICWLIYSFWFEPLRYYLRYYLKLWFFSDDLHEKEIEIKLEISKKAGLLKKPVRFTDVDARIDEAIPPNEALWNDYIDKNPVHRCIQVSAEMSHHEVLVDSNC